MSHLEERMQADLVRIRDWVWKIGGDVENALRDAKKTFVTRDEDLAYQTVLADHPINRDSRECDRMCHTFIARYLPGAGTLREMASTIRVNIALERIGDYAVTISREAIQPAEKLPRKFIARLDTMADEAIDLLSQSRAAFRDGNAELAIGLTKLASRVQGRTDSIYEELFAADDRMDGVTMMAIFVIFNMFKRVADQSKNICEQTIYAVQGIAKMPKVYRFLFLARSGSDAGQLAAAIGRQAFPESAQFQAATPGEPQAVSTQLAGFLEEAGLDGEELDAESLAVLEHDVSDFTAVISLDGHYSDYIPKVPFHTSALNWPVDADSSYQDQYRLLRSQITQLVEQIAGGNAN